MKAAVDASFAGPWLLADEESNLSQQVLEGVFGGEWELMAPQLWYYELANMLLSAHRRDRIASDDIREAHALLSEVPVTIYDHCEELARQRISTFAIRHQLSAYDAAYLELADRLQVQLLTADDHLKSAARAIGLAK